MESPKKSTIVEKTKDPLHIIYMAIGAISGLLSIYFLWSNFGKHENTGNNRKDTTIVVINQVGGQNQQAPSPNPQAQSERVVVKEVVRENTTPTPVAVKEEEPEQYTSVEPPPAQDFNVTKNNNKSGSSAPAPKKVEPAVIQVYCPARIVGTYEVKSGVSVKARIGEDLNFGDTYILKGTTLLGVITSVNNRLYLEFKDNKNLSIPLYAYDSNKNLGLLVQNKVSDGLNIYISNK